MYYEVKYRVKQKGVFGKWEYHIRRFDTRAQADKFAQDIVEVGPADFARVDEVR